MKYPVNVTLIPFCQHTPVQSRIVNDLIAAKHIIWLPIERAGSHLEYMVQNQGAMDLLTTHKLIG